MNRALKDFEKVIVLTKVSKSVMPVMVPTGQVFSHMLGVFASDDFGMLSLLSSTPHYWWAIQRASTMKGDLRYTPTDVFETFARPELTEELRTLGERLHTFRSAFMIRQDIGLTKTYNLVHDPDCSDRDIAELRRIHVDIDRAVADAYGWHDLQLDHDFHDTRQGTRYTVGPVVRQEILDRLLELNHTRYEAEVAQGLHSKGKKSKPAPKHSPTPDASTQPGLF